MHGRRILPLLAIPVSMTLAACASTTSGKGSAGAGSIGASTSGSATSGSASGGITSESSSPAGPAGSAAALAALLERGLASVQTVHLTLDTKAAGQDVRADGDEKLAAGKVVALKLTENISSISIAIIIVDGKTYAKLPASLNTSGKPYVLLDANSSDSTLRGLAESIDSSLSQGASLQSIGALTSAATSIHVVGKVAIGGVDTTHYSLVVDPSKITADEKVREALTETGVSTIPLELYVDSEGRPVQLDEAFSAEGQSISVRVSLTKYNQPVDISAPPPDQVASR